MRGLWFGGSFNPIHIGHLICARAAAESAGFDRVILVPSGQSPHKLLDTSMALASHRLAMCRAAVSGDAFFDVDDIETVRSGPSYTLNTVLQLKQRGLQDISWLIGADMAMFLPQWHQSARLMAEVGFVLMARPGWSLDWSQMPDAFRHLQECVVSAPQLDISSTQLRDRLAKGESIRYLTSSAVVEYIHQHRLYGVT